MRKTTGAMNMRLMPMIYLPVTLISLRRKLSDKNKGTGATGMVFCSFTRCSRTVIAAMRINLKHSDVYFRKP